MKPKSAVFLLMVGLALPLFAADSTNVLSFPVSGFSIAPLEVPPGKTACAPLIMTLPAVDKFAANVNVQIQPYQGTIEDYIALTLKQCEEGGLRVLEHRKSGTTAAVFEYSGELQGRSLHWYARAETKSNHVYLATATAAEDAWPEQGTELKRCVDSLTCDRGEPGAGSRRTIQHNR